MNKLKMRAAAAIVCAMALIGFSANGAFAFYKSGGCSIATNTLNVTNYSKGSGQEYHYLAKAGPYYTKIKVFVAGSQVASGLNTVDGFTYKSNPTADYTVTAWFYHDDPDVGMRQCSFVS